MPINGINTLNYNQQEWKKRPNFSNNISDVSNSVFNTESKIIGKQNVLTDDVYEHQLSNKELTSLKEDLEKTKKEQGFIGKGWDFFKNVTGLGAGSHKVKE